MWTNACRTTRARTMRFARTALDRWRASAKRASRATALRARRRLQPQCGFKIDRPWRNLAQDINECETGEHNCTPLGGKCWNKPGGYGCMCIDGFKGNGWKCEDINECEKEGVCHERAECFNEPGSFRCKERVEISFDEYFMKKNYKYLFFCPRIIITGWWLTS